MWKYSIQYTVPGFELTTFGMWVSSQIGYGEITLFTPRLIISESNFGLIENVIISITAFLQIFIVIVNYMSS